MDGMVKEKENWKKSNGFNFFTNKINILITYIYWQKKLPLIRVFLKKIKI